MRGVMRKASAQNKMIDEQLVPVRSDDLISRLNDAYPPRCKKVGETEEDHQRYAGIRTLLDELLGLLEEQNETAD